MDLADKVLSRLDITSLVGFDGSGSHPIHGSKTGTNLSVNGSSNEWYCFRHQVGGGPFQWLAISHFNTSCDQSLDYTRNNFKEILQEACRITGIEYKKQIISKNITYEVVNPKDYKFNFVPLSGTSKNNPGFPKSWKKYQTSKCSLEVTKNQNRFVVTGSWDPSNINPLIGVDLDVDPDNPEKFDLSKFLKMSGLPETLTVLTPSGGYHLYYLIEKFDSYADIPGCKGIDITKEIVNKHSWLAGLKGIDIKGQGGILFAPPTKWTSGSKIGQYKLKDHHWLKKLHSSFLDLFDFEKKEDTESKINDNNDLSVKKIMNQTRQFLEEIRENYPQHKIRNFEEVIYYDPETGIWKIDTEDIFLNSKAISYINSINCFDKVETRHINEIVNKQKKSLLTRRIFELDDFNKRTKFSSTNTILYCCNNSIIEQNYITGSFNTKEFDYHHYFRSKLNFDFNPDPDPSYWLDRLGEAIPNTNDLDLVLLFLAYSLIPDFSWKASLYLHGPANSGKTTLINNFTRVFDNVVRTKLSDLGIDLFALTDLLHADVWFINEIDKKYFQTESWKNVVEGGVIDIRLMYSGNKATKQVDFKTFHASNNLPKINDEATYYRIMPVKTPHRFERDQTNKIQNLLQENLDDFISWLIIKKVPEYFKRLGELTELQKSRTYDYYELNEDPWQRFCDEVIQPHNDKNETFEYTSEDIKEVQNKWAIEYGFDKLTTRSIGIRIGNMVKENLPPFQHAQYQRSNSKRYWTGILVDYKDESKKTKQKNLDSLL